MFNTYTIADFLKHTEGSHFHINRLEDMPLLPAHIVTPHKHHFYELFLVEKGTAIQMVDYQEYTLTENTFFLIAQGQLHFFEKRLLANTRFYGFI
jgi:AraC family transcriptional regulator, transcriptional activator of pobA